MSTLSAVLSLWLCPGLATAPGALQDAVCAGWGCEEQDSSALPSWNWGHSPAWMHPKEKQILPWVLCLCSSWSSAPCWPAWLPAGTWVQSFGSEHEQTHSGLHPAPLSAFGWFIPNPAGCTNQCWGWAPSSRIPSTQLESPIPFTQSDSAGDEALKLYWKLLLFPKEMFEVLIGFLTRLNQDEREKNWNFFADLWFKYQGKGWASGMVPFLCWPFF